MAGRPRSSDVDEAIAAAVTGLLAEQGYVATTVDAVAGRAGVPKSTLYRRWSSKAEMVFETIVHRPDLAPADDTGSIAGDLLQLCRSIVDSLTPTTARNALPGLLGDLLGEPDTARRFRRRLLGTERALVAAVLDRAVARGELRAGPSPVALHAQLLGTAFAWTVLFGDPVPTDLPERLTAAALASLPTEGIKCSTT